MTDTVTLYDLPPAFQTRLLRWLGSGEHGKVIDVAARDGKFVVTADPGGEHSQKSLERALNQAMRSRAEKRYLSAGFEKRVRTWLEAHAAHLTIGADGDQFRLAISNHGMRTEAVDEDLEVALVIAEEAFITQSGEDVELEAPETVVDVEPETIEARTRALGADAYTLPSATELMANARWSRAYVNSLPDTAFLYVEPGGRRDRSGRTHPLSLRHLPYRNRAGRVDQAHLHAALARVHQEKTDIPAGKKEEIFRRAHAVYEREFGALAANPFDYGERVEPPRRPPPARSRHREPVRHMIAVEEARTRREERPFDPYAPREHYARSHHFAVNHARVRHADKDVMREVTLGDTGYVLVVWDTHETARDGKSILGYAFYEPGHGEPIFEGEDFAASPMHAIDSDDTLRGILGFLTLRPGDTDRAFFEIYTPEQLAWAETEAESLQEYGMEPDP